MGHIPFMMTLNQYLIKHQLTSPAFAKNIGASVSAVRKWRQGLRIPRTEMMKKITRVTRGKVPPASWYV